MSSHTVVSTMRMGLNRRKREGDRREHNGRKGAPVTTLRCAGCNQAYKMRSPNSVFRNLTTDLCSPCRIARMAACTIYDRDANIGALPPNLKQYAAGGG